jgi:DNA-binding protein H-NS
MAIDLNSMSKDELLDLKKKIDKTLDGFEKRQKEAALAAAKRAAEEHGFSLEEILGKKSAGKTAIPKYRNPADPDQTWSGRGRQPAWYKSAIAAGTDPAELAI